MKCAVSSVSAFKEKCFSCPFVFCSFFDFFPLNFLCNPSYLWSFSVTSSYFPFFFFSTASTYKHMETHILGEKTHKTNKNICYARSFSFSFSFLFSECFDTFTINTELCYQNTREKECSLSALERVLSLRLRGPMHTGQPPL